MKFIQLIFFAAFSGVLLIGCSQKQNNVKHVFLGKEGASRELSVALSAEPGDNVIDYKTSVITDSAMLVNVAEPILFNMYGKENIMAQRPYEAYLVNDYWILMGTIPEGNMGGTFKLIMDSKNARIVKIIHDK